MGERSSGSAFSEGAAVRFPLISPMARLKDLRAVTEALEHQQTGEQAALKVLREGSLPTLICYVRGPVTPARTRDPVIPWISAQATAALNALLRWENAILPDLQVATGVVMPLIDVLQNTPQERNRIVACSWLLLLAKVQPAQHKAMAEAGVMGLLLALCNDAGKFGADDQHIAKQALNKVAGLARILVQSRTVAAHDLKAAIRAPEPAQSFGALLLLKACRFACSPFVLHMSV
jgi:hypothetical protein